ncbi:3-keto-5-aminohexanoate cleavage protein [Streptomyces yangpuensis]
MRPAARPAVVSLNGSRGAADGPAVPMSPQELAESAVRAVAAGAGEVLVHPRTPCGRESLSPRVVGPVLEVLRGAGVGVPLSVPASIGAEPDPAERRARVGAWTVLPDRAVVHFAEPGRPHWLWRCWSGGSRWTRWCRSPARPVLSRWNGSVPG